MLDTLLLVVTISLCLWIYFYRPKTVPSTGEGGDLQSPIQKEELSGATPAEEPLLPGFPAWVIYIVYTYRLEKEPRSDLEVRVINMEMKVHIFSDETFPDTCFPSC